MCNNNDHKNSILLFNNDIVSACEAAGQMTIPSPGPSRCKNLPGWTQTVAPLKEKALFWHRLWKDSGCPRTGQVANIRRCTRAKYHAAIRNVKRNENTIRNIRMPQAISESKNRQFWNEISRMNGCYSKLPSNIDGVTDDCDIAELFAQKFSRLYNSVPYDTNEMNALKAKFYIMNSIWMYDGQM